MPVKSYELYTVATDYVTAELMVWKRYRNRAPGIVEMMLDANPQLAFVHRRTPFIPVGTIVRMPIDLDLIAGVPRTMPQDALWTDAAGYRLP